VKQSYCAKHLVIATVDGVKALNMDI